MEIILGLVAGFYLGYKVSELYHKHAINDVLNDMGIDAETRKKMVEHCRAEIQKMESEINLIKIKIEAHQGQFYAFRQDTDQFIAQCASRDELIKLVQQKLGAAAVVEAKA